MMVTLSAVTRNLIAMMDAGIQNVGKTMVATTARSNNLSSDLVTMMRPNFLKPVFIWHYKGSTIK